ncbi:LysR substrate-binding domain-containing protein [Microbacterium sp. NPDC090003]|uniref:LysR substrate-binding domain-containing protein n=1 Tax=Microbacterium sp. NPDC090003 TaxID=3364203 RepID=UPI0038192CC1
MGLPQRPQAGGVPRRPLHAQALPIRRFLRQVFSVAAQVVRAGAAIAVMPRVTAASLATDGMVLRPVAGATLARHVDVLARPDAVAHASVRRVLRVIQDVAERGVTPIAATQ